MSQRLGGVVKKKYFCILKHLKIEIIEIEYGASKQ